MPGTEYAVDLLSVGGLEFRPLFFSNYFVIRSLSYFCSLPFLAVFNIEGGSDRNNPRIDSSRF